MSGPEVVNIVGSGGIGAEIDLSVLRDDLEFETAYIKGPGLYFRFDEESPTVIVSRSGKYIITGADCEEELYSTRERVLDLFEEFGIGDNSREDEFAVRNLVYTAELDTRVNLDTLAIYVGLDNIEYEPEQFPGLIYRPNNLNCVVLVFASGKLVITGVTNLETAEQAFEKTTQLISQIKPDSN